jgi:hypothetical protein
LLLQTAAYQCSTAGQVTNLGSTFPLTCGSNGNFIAPAVWPVCRTPAKCLTPPTPPTSSKLASSVALTVNEFDFANYLCKGDGTFISPVTGEGAAAEVFGRYVIFPTSKLQNAKLSTVNLPTVEKATQCRPWPQH